MPPSPCNVYPSLQIRNWKRLHVCCALATFSFSFDSHGQFPHYLDFQKCSSKVEFHDFQMQRSIDTSWSEPVFLPEQAHAENILSKEWKENSSRQSEAQLWEDTVFRREGTRQTFKEPGFLLDTFWNVLEGTCDSSGAQVWMTDLVNDSHRVHFSGQTELDQ